MAGAEQLDVILGRCPLCLSERQWTLRAGDEDGQFAGLVAGVELAVALLCPGKWRGELLEAKRRFKQSGN